MRSLRMCLVLVLGVMACARPARADVLSYTASFNSTGGNLGTSAAYTLQAFDPSKGTLNKVGVTIGGAISAVFVSGYIVDGLSGAPQPCSYSLHFDQGFASAANSFSSPATAVYPFSGATICGNLPVPVTTPMLYTFTFDSSSELSGFTTGSATGSISELQFNGRPSMFVDPAGGIHGTIDLTATIENLNLGPSYSLWQGGNVTVLYDYTPASPPVQPVPEPASLLMLAGGIMGAGLKRLRRL